VTVAQAIEIVMPRLSDSMEQGTVVRWLKEAGAEVAQGEPIVEIETDKATMEYEAEGTGVLEILAAAGETVPLGSPIARLVPAGSSPTEAHQTEKRDAAAVRDPQRGRATPVARRLAAALGIDLAHIQGTGRRGHIVKADVEGLAGNVEPPTAEPSAENGASAEPGPKGAVERQELTRLQRTVASRMAESRAVVPDFTLEVEIDMDACLELREQLKQHADPAPSINDMIVKACALSLRRHPRANGAYHRDGAFELYRRVNVGVAVAAQDALVVPVVTDADAKSIGQIARETRALAQRVREGEITPPELSGGTFSVSNLGMFGITRFTAIVNPPQAAILAVGAAEARPVVREGRLAVARCLTATLASDHRILYGADAALFLTDIRDRLQAPMSLLV
jgi:pyruvate dehydrogenase E2 component (dihydrolipoamide acetyltransferase)